MTPPQRGRTPAERAAAAGFAQLSDLAARGAGEGARRRGRRRPAPRVVTARAVSNWMRAHGWGEHIPALLEHGGRGVRTLGDCAELTEAELVVRWRRRLAVARQWVDTAHVCRRWVCQRRQCASGCSRHLRWRA